ncbi:adenosylcobinamide amidohydrolase [Hyphomicrobium sp.]|uniref:adenosylcobinamide amidohydrolase n=1 Tax=Hyphomicrobium sp. TaxID=82 RepID=UPI002FDD9720
MTLPFTITCRRPWLVASFDAPHDMLSWSLTKPGFQVAQRVAWLEVRNADLPPAEDPLHVIANLVADAGLVDAVTLITSRDITRYHVARSAVEGEVAVCLATVGLSNGERVGRRCAEPVWLPGTINTLVHVSTPLSQAALIETVSIVAQARTAALLEAAVQRAGVAVTGTGTDCIVVAAPACGGEGARFAGLHTAIGEAVGDAVFRAVSEGARVWQEDFVALGGDARSAAVAD